MPDSRAHSASSARPLERAAACVDGSPAVGATPDAALVAPSAELALLLARLQEAVAQYVAARRADGTPMERVLPEVQCVVREAESADGTFAGSEALLGQVMRWAVAAYRDEAERPADEER
jgi:hypothetical protein